MNDQEKYKELMEALVTIYDRMMKAGERGHWQNNHIYRDKIMRVVCDEIEVYRSQTARATERKET